MKLSINRSSLIITSLIAAFVLTAGVASAKEGREGRGQKMFERLDTNKDGKISKAESSKASSARFAKVDTNGDGVLTQQEVKAAHEARRAEHEKKRAEKGKDKPAREGKARDGKARQGKRGHSPEAFFAKVDTNNDGKISRAEAQKADSARFAKMDTNNDGMITQEEAKAAHKARRKGGKQACGEGKKKGSGDKSAPQSSAA